MTVLRTVTRQAGRAAPHAVPFSVRWPTPPCQVELEPGDVQAWRASLDAGPRALAGAWARLAHDERQRAGRFVLEHDRDRFIVARAFLRDVLARHLGLPADRVRFRMGPAGKPELEGSRLRFNLSHSRGLALLALTLDREIGVDVEALRPVPDARGLAERYFAPAEAARLGALPAADRDAAFLRCWTLKEAYVKGVGDGLGIALDGFEVSPAAACHEAWTLRSFDPGPGYVGALAVQCPDWRLVRFDWASSTFRAKPR